MCYTCNTFFSIMEAINIKSMLCIIYLLKIPPKILEINESLTNYLFLPRFGIETFAIVNIWNMNAPGYICGRLNFYMSPESYVL